MDIRKLLGCRIKELRKSKNITQERLAELVNIDTVSLSNIERGKYYPTAENLNKILAVLNAEPAELFNFQHLASHKELLDEMVNVMGHNENLTRLMYKFFKLVS